MLAWEIKSPKSSPWVKNPTPYTICLSSYNYKDIKWSSSIFTSLGWIWNYLVVTLTNFQRLKTNWLKIAKSDFWEIWWIYEKWVSKMPPYLSNRDTCTKNERVYFKWFRYEQKPVLVFKNSPSIDQNTCWKFVTKTGNY